MRRLPFVSVLTTVLALGLPAAASAQANRDMLGKARTQAERQALETLMDKLQSAGGQKVGPAATAAPPAGPHFDETRKAEELAKELLESPTQHKPRMPTEAAAIAPLQPAPTIDVREPEPTVAPPARSSAPADPMTRPQLPKVEPATIAPIPVLHQVPPPPAVEPPPGAPPPVHTAAPTASLPVLPPLPPPPSSAAKAIEAQAHAGHPKRPSPAATRRGQCTEILQRATLGELTEEDRTILKTQCR